MRWCPTPNSWCPCPSDILSPLLWSHQRKNPIGRLIDKEKKKLLTQEVPGQCGSCTNEDDDHDEGQETLALGPSLPGGRSHSLSTSSYLRRTRTKKNDFLLGWKYKSRCSLFEWGCDWTYCTQSADVSSWWIMFSRGAVVVCMFRLPGEVYP